MSELNPTEYEECLNFVEWLELMQNMGKVRVFTHIPNETFTTSWPIKMKNKRMGVRKGFPDYVVVTNSAFCFVEMKRKKGSAVSDFQYVWMQEFKRLGLKAKVCYGFEEAKSFVEENL